MSKAAKNEPAEATGEGEAPKKKGKSLILIIGAVLLLGGSAGGAWYFIKGKAHDPHKVAAPPPPPPPVYVDLEPFTVNLLPHGDDTFAQVGMSIKLSDDSVVEKIKAHMPEIRNKILLLLSSQTAEELATLEGKQHLSKAVLTEIKHPLSHDAEKAKKVQEVLFTSFVIQ